MAGSGTKNDPWVLKTPSGGSEYTAYRDESLDPPGLVVDVGKTQLREHVRALYDLDARRKEPAGWLLLASQDEMKPAADGTVEAWGRSEPNPVGGWYRL